MKSIKEFLRQFGTILFWLAVLYGFLKIAPYIFS